jgi:hypothetical protein
LYLATSLTGAGESVMTTMTLPRMSTMDLATLEACASMRDMGLGVKFLGRR